MAKTAKTTTTDNEYTLPLELTCSVTGKTVKYSQRKYIDKKIAEFGSLAALRKNFVSQEGKRQTTGLQAKVSAAVDHASKVIAKVSQRALNAIQEARERASA